MKQVSLFLLLFTILLSGYANASNESALSITGVVRQPLNLTISDLKRFQASTVQLNEIMQDGSYRGAFYFTGVPLKTLLETAFVEKEETAFNKKVDLAIRIKGENGKVVALSWGEVFYRNPDRIIVAWSATSIMPHHGCDKCHSVEEYQPRMNTLKRDIRFPKLVINSDTWADRSLDGIISIEVVDVRPKMPAQKLDKLYSKSFVITGSDIKEKTFKKLKGAKSRITAKHMGEGKGFHGIETFEGIFLKSILDEMKVKPNLSQVILASAPDGYRTLFSSGEIFLDPEGDRFLIADKMNHKNIEKGGKFILVPSGDLFADRDMKALSKLEFIDLKNPPKLYTIGMGCGDTSLITLEAISYMARVDAYVGPQDIKKRFAKYMGNKPVLFDIYDFAPPKVKRKNPNASQEELDQIMGKKREQAVKAIKAYLDEGKSVGMLDYGDPTIWSGWSWLMEYFPENVIQTIPGLSSFNVSNALLQRKMGCNGSIILTTTRGIEENPAMLAPLAAKGETLCIFMGLKDLDNLLPTLKKHYKPDTPAFLAYKAGYSGSEHFIPTTLEEIKKEADVYPEKFLGLIYVGPCLAFEKKEFCH